MNRKKVSLHDGIVKRYTSIVDWNRLNYVWSHLLIRCVQIEVLIDHLKAHPCVNSLYRLDDGVLAETIFPSLSQLHAFLETLQEYDLVSVEEFYVIESLGQELMLSGTARGT